MVSRPTLLERDFNIPPLDELAREIQRIGPHPDPSRRPAQCCRRFLNSSASSSNSHRIFAIPRAYPCPGGVESHRMEVYARLVYSNVESFLLTMLSRCKRRAGCAPVGRAREEFLGHPSQRLAFFPTDTGRVYPIPSDPGCNTSNLPALSAGARTLRVGRAGAFRFKSRSGLGSNRARRQLIAKSPRSKSGARQPELSLAGAPYWTAGLTSNPRKRTCWYSATGPVMCNLPRSMPILRAWLTFWSPASIAVRRRSK